MSKHIYIIITSFALALLAGCDAREQMPAPETGAAGEMTFRAAVEPAAKAYVDALSVLWDASDELAVFDNSGSQKSVFTLKSGAGTTSATFSGVVSTAATEFYAAYPASGVGNATGNIITLTLPSAQKLVEGGRNVDPAALIGVAATTGTSLQFKNLVSAIRFNIDMDNIVSVSFKGNTEEIVAGVVNADAATGLVDEIVEGEKEIVLTPAGSTFAKGQYLFSLLPGRFGHGVTLVFTDKDGNTVTRSNDNDLTISRNRLLDLSAFISLPAASFNFTPGQTREIPVLSQGVSSLAPHSIPEGWTVDGSSLGSGILKVTAPAATSGAPGNGVFDLRGTAADNSTVISDDITVRLFGINDKAEFLAFRSIYQGDDEMDNTRLNAPVTDPALIGDYLVDGALSLNADLSFTSEDLLLKAYVIKYLNIPIEGNGHTIDLDFTGEAGVCALVQYLCADVKNLKFTGKISYPYTGNGRVATLAALSNGTPTVKDVESAVDISASGKVQDLGGIVAYVNAGTVTLDVCSYTGNVGYTATEFNTAPAFGGLVGRVNSALTVKNSINSGVFNIDLNNRPLCSSATSGLGGILGVANAGKSVVFENVENKSSITVDNVSSQDVRERFSQTVGNNLAEADLSGIAANGTLVLNGFAGYALTFTSTDTRTLAYGGTASLDFTVDCPSGITVTAVSVTEAPAGWNIDLSHARESAPYIVVSAPLQDDIKAGCAVGIGGIVIEATLSDGSSASNTDKPSVRLYGINSKEEFNAFKTAYGPSANSPVITGLDDWLVNGAIALNTDLTISNDDLSTYYVVKFLDLPLEGNNRTITYNVSSAQPMLAFCQGLHADVSNLYFDGTMTATGKSPEVCMLAARGINTNGSSRKATEVSITNCHIKSTAVISYEYESTGSGAYVGGFVAKGTEANSTLTYRNCTVAGTIQSIKGACQGLAGFSGADGTGVGTCSKFYDCAFTGTVRLVQGLNKNGSIRIGGFVADNCRNSYFENCTGSGTITADMGGFVFNTSTKGSGIGGLLGYTQATDGTATEFKNCSFTGSISVVNMLASTAEYGWTDAENYDSSDTFGQIVGNQSRKAASGLETCTAGGTLTYSFKTE